jgi:hypothetical protein
MSLDYYLFCRNSYDVIIRDLQDIINILEEIEEYIKKEHVEEQTNLDIILANESDNKLFFSTRKQHMHLLRNVCNTKIKELCNHNFITDTIDITPDKSQNIRYCSICEYTEPN